LINRVFDVNRKLIIIIIIIIGFSVYAFALVSVNKYVRCRILVWSYRITVAVLFKLLLLTVIMMWFMYW